MDGDNSHVWVTSHISKLIFQAITTNQQYSLKISTLPKLLHNFHSLQSKLPTGGQN